MERLGCYITFDGPSGAGKGSVIIRCKKGLELRGKRVRIFEDRRMDPLRAYGEKLLPWCAQQGLDRGKFLFPVFLVGAALAEKKLLAALASCDFVLRDRSFVTKIAYTAANSDYTASALWDAYVGAMDVLVPELAVVLDVGVDEGMRRELQRKNHQDLGLGGKMSGNRANRIRIREEFLNIAQEFDGRMNVLCIENGGAYTEDKKVLRDRLDKAASQIFSCLEEQGWL